jgi:hypothetical protein
LVDGDFEDLGDAQWSVLADGIGCGPLQGGTA